MYVMTAQTLLTFANKSMVATLVVFALSVYGAYGMEHQLPLMIVTLLHVSQMVLAGVFKVSYVLRLAAQKQLGLAVR